MVKSVTFIQSHVHCLKMSAIFRCFSSQDLTALPLWGYLHHLRKPSTYHIGRTLVGLPDKASSEFRTASQPQTLTMQSNESLRLMLRSTEEIWTSCKFICKRNSTKYENVLLCSQRWKIPNLALRLHLVVSPKPSLSGRSTPMLILWTFYQCPWGIWQCSGCGRDKDDETHKWQVLCNEWMTKPVSTVHALHLLMTWGVIYVWECISLLLGTDCLWFTDGIEKAQPLNSNYISIFFVEKDALEDKELMKGY